MKLHEFLQIAMNFMFCVSLFFNLRYFKFINNWQKKQDEQILKILIILRDNTMSQQVLEKLRKKLENIV